MGDWPDGLKVGPIREWPGERTKVRRASAFKRPGKWVDGKWKGQTPVLLSQTLGELDLELRELRAKNVELLVAIPAEKFRVDGRPRADATTTHPGVILSFDIPNVGHVSYPCDTFTTWEDNLRAVTLALEALRKVNRYGVVKHGEQYRGFLAIEATAAPQGFSTTEEAITFLDKVTGMRASDWTARDLLRAAQRMTHPDRGGDAAIFQRVSLAEARLRAAGLL